MLTLIGPLSAQVQASNSGVRVVAIVENVPSYVIGEEAGITVTTASDVAIYRAIIVPNASSFYTEVQFEPGDVYPEEEISVCVFIYVNLNECRYITNSDEKTPYYVNIWLEDQDFSIDPGPSASGVDRV